MTDGETLSGADVHLRDGYLCIRIRVTVSNDRNRVKVFPREDTIRVSPEILTCSLMMHKALKERCLYRKISKAGILY